MLHKRRPTSCLLGALLMLVTLSGTATSSTTCPRFCNCTVTENYNLAAECIGTTSEFSTALLQLPTHLREFTFTAKTTVPRPAHREYFDLSRAHTLLKFQNLTKFKLQTQTQNRYFDFTLNGVNEDWVLCEMKKLESLHLNILIYQISNSSIACLQNLVTLDLSHAQKLSGVMIKGVILSITSKSVKRLLLKNVQTLEESALTRFAFSELLPPKVPFAESLEELDFSYNYINGLGPGATSLPNLKRLNFSGNMLLGAHARDPSSKATFLEWLTLHPSIEEVDLSFQGIFSPRRLRRASMTGTHEEREKLKCLEDSMRSLKADLCNFQDCFLGSDLLNLPHLCRQPSRRNLLQAMNSECYLTLPLAPRLRAVYLGSMVSDRVGTPSSEETTICFHPDNRLEVLDVSNDRLGEGYRSPDILNHNKLTGLVNVRKLIVENNKVQLSNPEIIDEFPALEVFRFAGNRITLGNSNRTFFKNVPFLRTLDLSRNSITDIQKREFANLDRLETLDLSGNQLSMLDFVLPNATLMKVLNVSNNLIGSIPASFAQSLLSICPNVTVDLRNNPLICGCDNLDFINTVQSSVLQLYKKEELICYSSTLSRVSIVSVDTGALKKSCSPMLQIIQDVGITLTVVFIAGALVFLWRKRWKIRRVLYRWRRRNYTPFNDDYGWDGFVAYSSEDKNWVHSKLIEKLEDKRNRRLFAYLRSILPNESLVERLDETICASRKVILVLSTSFLDSNYCLYDAFLAHSRLQQEGRDVVILVKLGRLPVADVPPMITRLLTTKTCLDWTEDADGQQLFWDRLDDELMKPPINTLRE